MTDGSRAGDIQRYSFMTVFANDATIDAEELAVMQRLALADGTVDAREREVLRSIFDRVSEHTVAPDVWAEIQDFRARHDIA